VNFLQPPNVISVSSDDVHSTDLTPEIGITGTPVIDVAGGTLYVVAKTKEAATSDNPQYVQRLHALDITTGAEKFGGPVVISASVAGSGDGNDGHGNVPFYPLTQNQRPALLLSNGNVIVGFASHGDVPPYHGWVLGYDATSLLQTFVFNTTSNGRDGGVWQSGCGPAVDTAGNIYVISGNGTFDTSGNPLQLGDSFIKLAPTGGLLDYFTPYDEATLDAGDLDLGSGGSLLLPDQPSAHPHLMVSAGKEGTIYLVDRDNMGHFQQGSDSQIVQVLVHALPGNSGNSGNYSAPAFWQGRVYFGAVFDAIKAFVLTGGLLSTTFDSQTGNAFNFSGGFPGISSNGANDGILWAIENTGSGVPGVLHAYDATNLLNELYNSNQASTRDVLDAAVKFSVATVANGRVYVGTASTLTVFGLLP
jgi:hypothetical protein